MRDLRKQRVSFVVNLLRDLKALLLKTVKTKRERFFNFLRDMTMMSLESETAIGLLYSFKSTDLKH